MKTRDIVTYFVIPFLIFCCFIFYSSFTDWLDNNYVRKSSLIPTKKIINDFKNSKCIKDFDREMTKRKLIWKIDLTVKNPKGEIII